MIETQHYEDFSAAAEAALQLLREQVGVSFWMATRIEGNDLIVLSTVGDGFSIKTGEVLSWADSLDWRMVTGTGPRVAPKVKDVAAYATAPFSELLHVGAYIGAPLQLSNGKAYGTLCGIDPCEKTDGLKDQQRLVEMVAGLLSAILAREKAGADSAEPVTASEGEVLIDHLTQVYNRRAWDRILTAEEGRCARHNHSACIIAVDIDGLLQINNAEGRDKGDQILLKTAKVLKRACRGYDAVARTGEDEFALLAVECGLKGAKGMFDRVNAGLKKDNIKASLGLALRNAATGLPRTFEEATNTLINAKRVR
ncbi:MAG: GGDEF domain-containing protein [Candidatus Eremiobacteraeota bacterium]|nr:GGDEF domain-containing protein [Candidatus Eremiobacteraeota bacterium]